MPSAKPEEETMQQLVNEIAYRCDTIVARWKAERIDHKRTKDALTAAEAREQILKDNTPLSEAQAEIKRLRGLIEDEDGFMDDARKSARLLEEQRVKLRAQVEEIERLKNVKAPKRPVPPANVEALLWETRSTDPLWAKVCRFTTSADALAGIRIQNDAVELARDRGYEDGLKEGERLTRERILLAAGERSVAK